MNGDGPPEGTRAWNAQHVLVAIAILALGHVLHYSRSVGCMDFLHFRSVARAVRAGEARDIYADAERERLAEVARDELLREREASPDPLVRIELERLASAWPAFHTYSTPWLYTVLAYTTTDSYLADQRRYQTSSLLLFALAIATLATALKFGWTSTALIATPVLLWYEPGLADMHVGNVNRLQLAALAGYAALAVRGRGPGIELASGAVLGLAVAFKPNLAFVVFALGIGWIVRGAWARALLQGAGFVLGAALAIALSARFFGSLQPWASWWTQMTQVLTPSTEGDFDLAAMPGNFSLARWLPGIAPRTAALTLLLGFAATLYAARRRLAQRARGLAELDIAAIGVGGATSVLASPLAWLHYYVLVLPLGLYLLRPARGRGVRLRLTVASLSFVGLLPIKFFLPLDDRASGGLVIAGTIGLLALAAWDLLAVQGTPPGGPPGTPVPTSGGRALETPAGLEHPILGR